MNRNVRYSLFISMLLIAAAVWGDDHDISETAPPAEPGASTPADEPESSASPPAAANPSQSSNAGTSSGASVPVAQQPSSFFTLTSFLTLSSATGIVVVVVNTIRHVTGKQTIRWIAFLISLIVAVIGYFITTSMPGGGGQLAPMPWYLGVPLALLNGCLIYTSAFGVQNIVITPRGDSLQSLGDPGWRSPW